MKTKYWGNWDDLAEVKKDFFDHGWREDEDFEVPANFPTEEEILFACYSTPSYEGYALVLYLKDGKLYEVNGSHCSCYGLEGQWKPEETSLAALKARKFDYQEYEGLDYLQQLLGAMEELGVGV